MYFLFFQSEFLTLKVNLTNFEMKQKKLKFQNESKDKITNKKTLN